MPVTIEQAPTTEATQHHLFRLYHPNTARSSEIIHGPYTISEAAKAVLYLSPIGFRHATVLLKILGDKVFIFDGNELTGKELLRGKEQAFRGLLFTRL